jgi:hypothetical protein
VARNQPIQNKEQIIEISKVMQGFLENNKLVSHYQSQRLVREFSQLP